MSVLFFIFVGYYNCILNVHDIIDRHSSLTQASQHLAIVAPVKRIKTTDLAYTCSNQHA